MILSLLLACSSGLTAYDTWPSADDAPKGNTTAPTATGPATDGELPPPVDDSRATDTGTVADTDVEVVVPEVLAARVAADVTAGAFPLTVTFDPSTSDLGSGTVSWSWDFGDGAAADGELSQHTYVGAGSFEATLTLLDEVTGESSIASVTIEVSTPSCPSSAAPAVLGHVDDDSISELSGVVASHREPGVYWSHEDSGNDPTLFALDEQGTVISRHGLPDEFADFEDLAAATDPETGEALLFLGDIGDNGYSRDEIAVWIAAEPDAHTDGDATATRMALTYPDGARNAETLLVDPLTLDLYIVTKEGSGPASVYAKRAPHVGEGPFVLESLGEQATLDLVATGGDVSMDGTRVVVRDYTTTARLFFRDGYLPFEDSFAAEGCPIGLASEQQGEAVAFTADERGMITVSEGTNQAMNYVEL